MQPAPETSTVTTETSAQIHRPAALGITGARAGPIASTTMGVTMTGPGEHEEPDDEERPAVGGGCDGAMRDVRRAEAQRRDSASWTTSPLPTDR